MYVDLNIQTANRILRYTNLPQAVDVVCIKKFNHTYKISLCDGQVLFLKTFTKDWYGDYNTNATETTYCALHEEAAYKMLKRNGLRTPEIVITELHKMNPFGRPFLLTKALRGTCLTDAFAIDDLQALVNKLTAVGKYMKEMHAIVLQHPGYIVSEEGPNGILDENGWQHTIWTAKRWREEADKFIENHPASSNVPQPIIDGAKAFYNENRHIFESLYTPYVFIHGDCHASQFFVDYDQTEGWQVTGVVDMEVASAGTPVADWGKIIIELSAKAYYSKYYKDFAWWEPLFKGYGGPFDFTALKVGLLTAGGDNFACQDWPMDFSKIYQHIFNATDWRSLFDLTRY